MRRSGFLVLALFVALAGGILGAAATNGLGWRWADPLPAGTEISRTVFPGLPVWGGGNATGVVRQNDGEGLEFAYAVTGVDHTAATRDVAAYTAGVRARLEAAGWTVTGVAPPPAPDRVGANPADRSEGFTATRGRLGLRFNDHYWAGRSAADGDGNATYYLWQQPPSWLAAVTGAGFLPGALAAGLLTVWVRRRLRPQPRLTAPAATVAVLAVICVVPATVLALLNGGPADESAAPSWEGLAVALKVPALLFATLAALLLVAAVRPDRLTPSQLSDIGS